MKFFDKKEEVIDIQLTQYGKHLLSVGRWKPVYYAFFDDNILYNGSMAEVTEGQSEIEDRIQELTPQLHTQHTFTGRETDFLRILEAKEDKELSEVERATIQSTAEKDYSLISPIGTANFGSQEAPRWIVKILQGTIHKTLENLTGSFQALPIPQLDLDLTYKISPQSISNYPKRESFAQVDAEELGTGVFQDGTFFDVKAQTILIDLEELNVPFDMENFDIQVFEMEQDEIPGIATPVQNLNQLFFQQKKPQIVNNILVSDRPEFQSINKDPTYVEYYFDVFVDHEIDTAVMSSAITELKSKSLYVDAPYITPEVPIVATTANLYEDQTYTDLVTCNDENSNVAPKATIKSKKGPFKKIEKPMDNGDENS